MFLSENQFTEIANHEGQGLQVACFVPLRHSKPKRFLYKSVTTSTVRKLNSCALHKNLLRESDEKKRIFTER